MRFWFKSSLKSQNLRRPQERACPCWFPLRLIISLPEWTCPKSKPFSFATDMVPRTTHQLGGGGVKGSQKDNQHRLNRHPCLRSELKVRLKQHLRPEVHQQRRLEPWRLHQKGMRPSNGMAPWKFSSRCFFGTPRKRRSHRGKWKLNIYQVDSLLGK